MTNKANNNNKLTVNEAGGLAYDLGDRASLAQIAATGCISDTYYASEDAQLETVKNLVNKISQTEDGTLFIAKLAIYSRKNAFMKDMPALLLSYLAFRNPSLYEQVFPTVMDNTKMVRNHVQFVRSGLVDGKKSFPRAMRRQLKMWFARMGNARLFKDSVGNNPSIADVIKMVHPKPQDAQQEALYSYLIGNKGTNGKLFNSSEKDLPEIIKNYENCKTAIAANADDVVIPDLPFQMLDSLGLNDNHWKEIARNAKWTMTRMNLNTFMRHNVFDKKDMINLVAQRLRDPDDIKNAKVFPYQLMAAYMNTVSTQGMPFEITEALQDALDISLENIPNIPGNIWVFPDVSGSMGSSITGRNKKPSSIRCIDVAALVASAILRKNRQSNIIPFDTTLKMNLKLNPRDSVMTNAKILSSIPGGGTYTSLGVRYLAETNQKVDLVIYVSDNESWVGGARNHYQTETLRYWDIIKKNNPTAKMVCIDIQPYASSQAPNRDDVLNIGGFSDTVWETIAQFAKHGKNGFYWLDVINNIEIS
jgi:60 kDa SS-A/Ro ribonucleoprotein